MRKKIDIYTERRKTTKWKIEQNDRGQRQKDDTNEDLS